MKTGTINGQMTLIGSGVSIEVDVLERSTHVSPGLVVRGTVDGVHWETPLAGIEGDPRRIRASSSVEDFSGILWEESGLFAIAGESAVFWIQLANGSVRSRYELRFLGKASLEVLELQLSPRRGYALVASTKRVLVFGTDGELRLEYDPPAFIATVRFRADNEVVIEEYDLSKPDLPVSPRILEFDS
jgi:hypothetical protein